jgi:hypothetical protein
MVTTTTTTTTTTINNNDNNNNNNNLKERDHSPCRVQLILKIGGINSLILNDFSSPYN